MTTPPVSRALQGDPPRSIFRDGSIPVARTPSARTAVRLTALGTIALTGAYLAWRVAAGTVSATWWWVAIPLLVVELHNAFGLVLYTIALWDVDVATPAPPPEADEAPAVARPPRVAVLIPTYNEPADVLLPTIAASVALQPAHETWVLDDGRRDEIRVLAKQLGARYLTRSDNRHAKAGNLNHALGVIEADIVAVLDADHVPTASFLTATLPYFADPKLAFVQTPQDFYNLESFEHERKRDGNVFNEEAVFYRVIAPAKNRWGAPFWCGTCALIRVDAIRSVGGVATDSVTEDIETTIRMFRRGWSGAYHNQVLAHGLAPDDASSYLLQRNRWALGAMQVLRKENPLFGRGLRVGQRLAFLTTLFGWFDSWRTLAYMVIPIVVVATGAVPIEAPGEVFGPFFLATLVSQFVALRLLARGHYPPVLSLLFEVLRMPAVLPATLTLLRPRASGTFKVTPKGRNEAGRVRVPVPPILTGLAVAGSLGLAWFTATLLGLTAVTYAVPWAAIGAAGFIAMNLALVLAAIGRIRSSRFAGNRRAGVRLPIRTQGSVDGYSCEVIDVSITGARLRAPTGSAFGETVSLELHLPGGLVELDARVRRVIPGEDGVELGLSFEPGQAKALARLAVAVFHEAPEPLAPARRRARSRRLRQEAAA
jgi:cellulose synthase (UDP-forming)